MTEITSFLILESIVEPIRNNGKLVLSMSIDIDDLIKKRDSYMEQGGNDINSPIILILPKRSGITMFGLPVSFRVEE